MDASQNGDIDDRDEDDDDGVKSRRPADFVILSIVTHMDSTVECISIRRINDTIDLNQLRIEVN